MIPRYRYSFLVFGLVIITASTGALSPVAAQSLWERILQIGREAEPTPDQTLVAPFATENQRTAGRQADRLPVNKIALDQPHRTDGEIRKWLVHSVSNATSISTGTMADKVQSLRPYFTEDGHNQYKTFLAESRIEEFYGRGDVIVQSYVEGQPLLLNEGVVNTVYRWLYQIPITVTYLKRGAAYEDGQYRNVHMTLNVQIGRSQAAADAEGMQIELWSYKLRHRGR